MLSVFSQGFLLQASLILALGAQNIFVLNAGLRRQKHLLVATVCSLCDAILVFVGVLGVASVFVKVPLLKISLGLVGVAFLFFYAFLKLKETAGGVRHPQDAAPNLGAKQSVLTALGFSLLNPHVYLDTVVLIGGYSAKFPAFEERFYFGAGASIFSALWFFALALLASASSRLLNSPRSMRVISLVSGVILLGLALKLSFDVLEWIEVLNA